MRRGPLQPREERTAETDAARILSVPRFARDDDRAGWVTNGMTYSRDSVEALARLARVIELRPKIGGCEMRLGHGHDAGRKVLTIWWRGKGSPTGVRRGGRKPLPPAEKAARVRERNEINRRRNRERTLRRKAAGQCILCGREVVERTLCGSCCEKRARYRMTRNPVRKKSA